MKRASSGTAAFIFILLTVGCKQTNLDAKASLPGSPDQSSHAPPSDIIPTPTPPSPTPNPGRGSSGGAGGLGISKGSIQKLQLNSDTRSQYYFYVPPGYNESQPMGLVMLFHGVEPPPEPSGFITVSVYRSNMDRFILVSPVGDINDGGTGAWCQPYAREIMDLVRSKYNIATGKQYMAALSGGGYPGIWLALGSGHITYRNICGQMVRAGYQDEFAAVGFTSSAYEPGRADFAGMVSQTATQLGFAPGFWADYGQNSSDGPTADKLKAWADSKGYSPSSEFMRAGEGHAPQEPFAYLKGMFDMFAGPVKP